MKSTSPPRPVTARPVATPGTDGALVRLRGEPRPAEQLLEVRLVDVDALGSPVASLVAALRSALASSRSICRTPASRV